MITYVLLKQVVPVPYKHFSDQGYEMVAEAKFEDSAQVVIACKPLGLLPKRAKK